MNTPPPSPLDGLSGGDPVLIIRILGEGQWLVGEDHMDRLNELDDDLDRACDSGDEDRFGKALEALLAEVRSQGERVNDEDLHGSDLILPPSDATLDEVRGMLNDDGLIPG